ncbi:MAG: toprim domain-containing protein [Nanoarchaeota archaeon]
MYKIKIRFFILGKINKKDIIGAIFKRTKKFKTINIEETYKKGLISRINIVIDFNKELKESIGNKLIKNRKSIELTTGFLIFDSYLDKKKTSLIISTIEQIDRVSFFPAIFRLEKIESIEKIIKKRAKKIEEIIEKLEEKYKTYHSELIYPKNIKKFDEVIIVEGLNDYKKLYSFGFRNLIAIGGTNIDIKKINKLKNLLKNKRITLLLDNDKGGYFIYKKLKSNLKIDNIIFSPKNKKVEELTKKEVIRLLKNKVNLNKIINEINKTETIVKLLSNKLNI